MALGDLLTRQWSGYGRAHAAKANLLLHAFAVPLFLLGNVTLLVGLIRMALPHVIIGAAAMAVGLALQGKGHKIESVPPEPFTGPANAFARLFLEQWVSFPRFVLSGEWFRALKRAT